MSRAFFAGTFNPYTVGHDAIVRRALGIFDSVVIGIGYNVRKEGSLDAAIRRAEAISRHYAGEPRVEVTQYSTLTADAARLAGADVLLRGVRSVKDFEYERDMADVNRRISGMETVLLIADPEMSSVSSSVVRELESFGRDVSAWKIC